MTFLIAKENPTASVATGFKPVATEAVEPMTTVIAFPGKFP
ncbi:MAG: hypothetical protein KIPDCIKN_01826 [Haliscomenobacter sp.]|nr:hypothetical protein [Haliscomenobacter sp.]